MKRNTTRTIALLLALLVGAAVALGAAGTTVAPAPARAPERIVSLAPSNTEILFSLGLGSKIVGVTTACDYPVAAKAIDKIGDYSINIEAVLAKRPDLVVAVSELQAQVIDKLRELKVNVVAVNPTTISEVLDAIQAIGDAAGRSDLASVRVAELRARMAAVAQRTARMPAAQRPTVFVEIWNDPLMTAGGGTFVDDLITAAGGRNIFSSVSGWPQVSHESVVAARPSIVILTAYNLAEATARREWRALPAVVKGQVYEVLPDILVRPGPRLIDGLEALEAIFRSAK